MVGIYYGKYSGSLHSPVNIGTITSLQKESIISSLSQAMHYISQEFSSTILQKYSTKENGAAGSAIKYPQEVPM